VSSGHVEILVVTFSFLVCFYLFLFYYFFEKREQSFLFAFLIKQVFEEIVRGVSTFVVEFN